MKKKILSIIFAFVLTFGLCLFVCANEWYISSDKSNLILNDTSYDLYDGYLYPSDFFSPKVAYEYDDTYQYHVLRKNKENSDILYTYTNFYVSEKGKTILDDFAEGNYYHFKISNQSHSSYVDISHEWLKNLDGGVYETLDVRDLKAVSRYYVLGYDETETVAHIIGAIYYVYDKIYFINYDALDNNYFDSYGYFSYLKGSVNAYRLNNNQAIEFADLTYGMEFFQTVYENDDFYSENSDGFYFAVFIIVTTIFGFAIPIAILVIGVVRILTSKTKNPKRWYLLIGCCAFWILTSLGVLLCMIF